MSRRRILIPIFYRGHHGRLRPVLRAIEGHPRLELLTVTAQQAAYRHFWFNVRHSEPPSWRAALPWYLAARLRGFAGSVRGVSASRDYVVRKLRDDAVPVGAVASMFLDGGTPAAMAKSVGLGLIQFVDFFRKLRPDFVFVNADRFEMMAVVLAAAYLNIPIAHHEAGDVSGTIDESVRHAITKFSQVHLAATEASRRRVLQMGENPAFAFTVGSPAIDALAATDLSPRGSFGAVRIAEPYLLVLYHPVTTVGRAEAERGIRELIAALERQRLPLAIIGANSDARADVVGTMLQQWYEAERPARAHFQKSTHPDVFYRLLANAACAVGNSSSFIREGAFLGTPAVLIGDRQHGRDRGRNVAEVPAESEAIGAAIARQLAHGRYPSDGMFGRGDAAARIAEILSTVNPPIQKQFHSYPMPSATV